MLTPAGVVCVGWYSIPGDLGCGYVINTKEGALTDGSGIDANYRNNLNCIWILLVPIGYSITLRVQYQVNGGLL